MRGDSTCGSFPKVVRTGKDAGMVAEPFDMGDGLVSKRRVFLSFFLLTDVWVLMSYLYIFTEINIYLNPEL